MRPIPELTERQKRNFWSKIHIGGVEDCWEWEGLTNRQGHGRISFENKDYIAHRVAHFLYLGIDPLDSKVIQTCGDHGCCNPAHFQLKKTQSLNESQIQCIREQAAQGVLYRTLAKQYNVARSTIYDIVNRRTWKDI